MAVVERLAHFLTGWVEFEVRGNGPRFFNTAAKAGVEFWGFSRQGERLSARGTPGDYKRLRELARPGDLILTVGAGDIYTAGEALVRGE